MLGSCSAAVVIEEEENLVFHDRAAEGASELIEVVSDFGRRRLLLIMSLHSSRDRGNTRTLSRETDWF